jgi:hypothetical protein
MKTEKGRAVTLPDDEGLIDRFVMVDADDERTDDEIRAEFAAWGVVWSSEFIDRHYISQIMRRTKEEA